MKGKPKQEFEIKTPKLFGEKAVGKTFAEKSKNIIGRKFTVYAKDIWERSQKYYYKFDFKIEDLKDDKLVTSFKGHEISRAFISKSVRKFSTRIDLYIKGKTKSDFILVLKPLIITTMNVKTSVSRNIRREVKRFLELYIRENTLDKIVQDIISDNLQRDLKKSLNAIYPISTVEIRKSEVKLK